MLKKLDTIVGMLNRGSKIPCLKETCCKLERIYVNSRLMGATSFLTQYSRYRLDKTSIIQM